MHRMLPAASAAVIALALSGCVASGPSVSAAVIDNAVEVQPTEGAAKPIETAGPVALGETVTTDEAGLSEVTFADESYTRVGPSSALTIVELSNAEAQRTVTLLDLGQTWHRVKEIVAEDGVYQVDTPLGTASVRGTAFSVTCESDEACEITVIEGTVEFETADGTVITINAFERLTLPGEEAVPVSIDTVKADEWIMRNLELDGVELADASEAAGLEDWQASAAGTWHLVYTVTASDDPGLPVGTTQEADWDATSGECTENGCGMSVSSSTGRQFDVSLDASGLSWTSGPDPLGCEDIDTGVLLTEYGFDQTTTTELSPANIETVDGVPTVTEYRGIRTVSTVLKNPPDPSCADPVQPTSSATIDVVMTRTG